MMLRPTSLRFPAAVVLALATLGLVGSGAPPAVAADWTVETAANTFGSGREDFRYTVNPGGEIEDGIVVLNHGAGPLQLSLRTAAGATSREGRLELVTADATSKGLGAWVRLDREDVTVEPGESVEVPFAIALPGDAAPGDYAGGIVVSGDEQAGIPIRLRVGGALKPGLSVEDVQVDYSGTANPIGKGDATVTYAIHNTGNATLTARQTVSVSGPFSSWAADAGKLADSPPLLPGETWKVSAPLHGVAPALRLSATVTLIPLLTDAAGSTAPLAATKASGHALVVPWSLLLTIAVLGTLAVAGLRVRPRFGTRVQRVGP